MKKFLVRFKRKYKGDVKRILAYGKYFGRFRIVKRNGKRMMEPRYEDVMFDAINLDINNTCNLRCRFCFNTFEKEPCYMSEDTFRKILELFPLTKPINKGGGIFFSCLYEPAISPHFIDFLKLLPREGRKKVFFTSNFCRPLSKEELRTILSANLHHINISVETFQPERYKEICSSIQFDSFYHNLEKLAEVYSGLRGYRPKLYYITMILKANRDEVASIVKFCSEKLFADRHDLRTPYISTYDNMKWNREQLMDVEECARIRQELEALHLPITVDIHSRDEMTILPEDGDTGRGMPDEPEEKADGCAGGSIKPDISVSVTLAAQLLEEIRFCMEPEYFFIRFHSSGVCTFNVTKETCSISEIKDPAKFYRNKLYELYERRARAFLCPKSIWDTFSGVEVEELPMRVMFNEITANPVYLFLSGWVYLPVTPEEEILLFLMAGQGFFTFGQSCPDWADKPAYSTYGFAVCIDRNAVKSDLTDLEFWIVRKRDLQPMYRYRYPYGILWKPAERK